MNEHDHGQPRRYRRSLVPALVVIAIGAFFLLDNLGFHFSLPYLRRWWAWLILVGTLVPLSTAFQRWREVGRADAAVLHSLLSAAGIAMVAAMFLIPLSWATWWPVFVIYGGLHMLIRSDRRNGDSAR